MPMIKYRKRLFGSPMRTFLWVERQRYDTYSLVVAFLGNHASGLAVSCVLFHGLLIKMERNEQRKNGVQ
jgi:hypothetical protein